MTKVPGHFALKKVTRREFLWYAWLGAPAIFATGAGRIRTGIPNGLITALGIAPTAPWLAKHLPQASHLEMSADLISGARLVDAEGQALAALTAEQGEGSGAALLAGVFLGRKRT